VKYSVGIVRRSEAAQRAQQEASRVRGEAESQQGADCGDDPKGVPVTERLRQA
jgi:hypothetical protein